MCHTLFSRLCCWVVIVFLSCHVMATSALAQEQGSKKNSDQSEPDPTGEGKPEKKKQPEKKTEKEKKPRLQILGSKVTYSTPRRWTKPQISTRAKLEALQFTIPLPVTGTAAPNTSAIVIAEPNTDKLSLVDFSNSKIPRKYPAGAIIADQTDGDSWRTVLSYVHEGNPPYTVLDRFGVTAEVRVHFRIIFPKEDDAKVTWPKTLSQESSDFIRNLRINEQNKALVEVYYNSGNWGLHEAKAGKKIADQEAPKETQKAKAPTTKKTVSNGPAKVGEEFSP